MISEALEKEIKTLPESTQSAVRFNIELLDLADYGKNDEETLTYLTYMSKKFILVDMYQEDGDERPVFVAFIYSFDDKDFIDQNKDGLFKCVFDKFREKSCNLKTKTQLAEQYRPVVDKVGRILSAYVSRRKDDVIAEMTLAKLKEDNAVGLDVLIQKKPDPRSRYAQNNLLTKAGFSKNMTIVQKKLLNYFIFKFQTECKTDLFGEAYITVTTQELVRCGCGSNQTALVKSLKELTEKTSMYIQYGERWSIYNIFSSFTGDPSKKKITVRFTPEMTALISKIGVVKNYTLLKLNSINSIKRYSAMRMYELCCQYKNADSPVIYITDEQLRKILNCTEKYLNPFDFKKRILKDAETELKELAEKGEVDLYFDCVEVEKEKSDWQYNRKKVTKWAFVVHKAPSFVDGSVEHDGVKRRMEMAYRVIEDIFNKRLADELTDDDRQGYLDFIKTLNARDVSSLVQDLQLEVLFSGNEDKVASVEIVFRKYGFREVLN